MTFEVLRDELIQPWRDAVERTAITPGPAGGPEYMATADRALGEAYVLHDGDLFMPFIKARTSAARFFKTDVYEGMQTNSFLGIDSLNDRALAALEELPKRAMVLLHLPVETYQGFSERLSTKGFQPYQEFTYHKVLLSDSFEEWFQRPSVKRILIRKATKNGVTVSLGGAELLDDFYKMYLKSFERWQGQRKALSHHSRERFERMFTIPESGSAICLAHFEGRVIAAGLVCAYNRTAAGLYGGIDYKQRSNKPSNLLYAELLHKFVKRGVREYNMGTSGGFKSVESFKESLGAQKFTSIVLCRHRFPRLQRLLVSSESDQSVPDGQLDADQSNSEDE
jgi:lipid II:glycine glycyltransferase (peptidoglycan interpeptide bridge formation enzyme)